MVELTGYSQSYLTRILRGTTGTQPIEPIVIDPREYESEITMNDEEVLKWQAQPYCLCGCGRATLQEQSPLARVPRGAYRLFVQAHFRRLPRYRQKWIERNKSEERRQAIKAAQHQNRVYAEDVRELVWRWRSSEPGRTVGQLAALAGLSTSHLHNLVRQEHVFRLSAARIYAAAGEPMTREMARSYRRYLRNRHLDGPPPIVLD